jgi:hypothetical protein
MPEEVYEWFAHVGYEATLAMMQKADMIEGGPEETPKMRITPCDETEHITVGVEGEDRRVVFDEWFGWLWYNAAGPECAV